MNTPKIISPQIEDISRVFMALAQEMNRQKISCVLIAHQTNEHMALISQGDQAALAGAIVAQLKHTLAKCNQEVTDITKGLILKEIFNQ
jgi:hypothetical protein